MTDYRKMFDESDYLFAFDLDGKEVTVTIASVAMETLIGSGGKTARKPVATFAGKKKRLALNRTNCRTLVQLSGSRDVENWVGLSVTLYATTTQMGPDIVDCIRIRGGAK